MRTMVLAALVAVTRLLMIVAGLDHARPDLHLTDFLPTH
ncbi:MAG: hypothetical protein JWN03_2262 [Nocardia sp.]|nr:hypothetical protein [Nocardia sp.]